MFLFTVTLCKCICLEVRSQVAIKIETSSLLRFLLLVYAEQGGVAQMEWSVVGKFLKVKTEDVLSRYMKSCMCSSFMLPSRLFSLTNVWVFFYELNLCFQCLFQAVLEISAYYEI